jgi:hypothetical protein
LACSKRGLKRTEAVGCPPRNNQDFKSKIVGIFEEKINQDFCREIIRILNQK